jgi:hypothetical protein
MIPLVEIPDLVRHYEAFFQPVFSAEALCQFQRYVSGLIVSENKTVEGINRGFVIDLRHQSSLNRFLTASPFAVEELNRSRLEVLASRPGTRLKPRGVLSLDDTLLTHYGEHFEKIAYLYDPTQDHYVWAHNLVNLHYSDDQTDYPVCFRLWEPADLDPLAAGLAAAGVRIRESKRRLQEQNPKKWRHYLLGLWRRHQHQPAVQALYQSKLLLGQEMATSFYETYPDLRLPLTFDPWYTQPAFCRYLDRTLQVPYVGTLSGEDPVRLASGEQPLAEFDEHLCEEHQEALKKGQAPVFQKITIPFKGNQETYYSYCRTHRFPNLGKQRLVLNHRQADLSDGATYFISNRLQWQAAGITRIRRHRWPVEVYHEEGKAAGLDQYQVRDFEAIYRHIALVAVTYSLLRVAPHDPALLQKLHRQVQTRLDGSAGAVRRHTQAQALWAFGSFLASALAQGQPLREVMQPFLAAVAY